MASKHELEEENAQMKQKLSRVRGIVNADQPDDEGDEELYDDEEYDGDEDVE